MDGCHSRVVHVGRNRREDLKGDRRAIAAHKLVIIRLHCLASEDE